MTDINLIIIAMNEELSYFLKGLNVPYTTEQLFNEDAYYFEKNNEKYLVVRGKVGKSSTSLYIGRLSVKFNIKRIINIGTSGGFSKCLKIGDVVIATEVSYHDVDATGFGYEIGQVPGFPKIYKCEETNFKNKIEKSNFDFNIHFGRITSGDSFITKKNLNKFDIYELNPLCVEMEAGSVGQCAYQLGIPFIVIRSISDIVTANENEKDSVFNIDACCANCVKVLMELI